MTAELEVLHPGLRTTVQDLGRAGFQRLGIPSSGALDWIALRAANVVVGNPPATAGLEILLGGPTLQVAADSVRIAVAGGRAAIEVLDAELWRVPAMTSVLLERGQRFRVGAVTDSLVAYLAIAGGLDLPPVLGSLSTYVRAGLGGVEGRPLQSGDRLPLKIASAPTGPERQLDGPDLTAPRRVRAVLGPQDDYFAAPALEVFRTATYTVTRDADRMGLRLEGPSIAHLKGYDIVSDAIAPGAVQVPGNGQPIVLLADRQTTGGYPKIATVISTDVPALGRLGPGARITFEIVSIAQAEQVRRDLEREISGWAPRPAHGPGLDALRLAEVNLVSGVVDACAVAVEDA